ncbi:hypothetical protein NKI48_29695 [Mesorhizobium sp. M0644]|uniref:hypothetical protein n=1 Tax=Mesorhizobium sp. M0644 TaxID=2956979 RepID=UPI0033395C55
MRNIIVSAIALIAFSGTTAAQPMMSREETLAYVSKQLAEIQGDAKQLQTYTTIEKSALQERIDEILRKAVELRDVLSTNHYVQVTGFSVTIPWGVTFEFAFPTPSEINLKP